MELDTNAIEVVHNQDRQRFEVQLGDQVAELNYTLDDGVYVITHTGVPVAFRGRGIADRLAAAALDHVQAVGGKVVPMCWFVAAFIRRHKEYEPLVVE